MKKRTALVLGPGRRRPRSPNKPPLTTTNSYRKQSGAPMRAGAQPARDVLAGMFTLVGVLRRSEERLTQAVDVMHLGLFEHDRHTDEIYWSPMIRDICEWGDEEPPSLEGFLLLIHPEDREQATASIERSHDPAGDGLCDIEHRLLRRDGSVHWVNLRLRTFFEGAGMTRRPVRTIGALLDITERKQLEAQIAQSQKMEAVGRMAGRIVHDFNNILTVVNGYLDLLLGQLDPGSLQYREASEIAQAGDRAAKLTRQLLAVSQRQVLRTAPLDLNRVIMDLSTLLSPFMGENIQVKIDLASDLSFVMADRMQIEQILMNLAVNARDAMPHGGMLTFETANVLLQDTGMMKAAGTPAGPYVRLSLRDTGQGMDDHTRAHLFEPFFTTKAAGQGAGLGLAMVYGVIAESRGFIRVESAPGRGATFHIFLPQVEQRNPDSKTGNTVPGTNINPRNQ